MNLVLYTTIFTFNRNKTLNTPLGKASRNKIIGSTIRIGRDIARDGRRAKIKWKKNDYKGAAKIVGRSAVVNAVPSAMAIAGQALPIVPTTPLAIGLRQGLNKVIPKV